MDANSIVGAWNHSFCYARGIFCEFESYHKKSHDFFSDTTQTRIFSVFAYFLYILEDSTSVFDLFSAVCASWRYIESDTLVWP